MAGGLLRSDLLARLRRLQWWLHEGSGAARAGVRGRLRPPAAEFFDHRPYTPGDDPRYLDWRLLARLRRPFVRRGEARRGATVALVVDASASMGIGGAKLTVATELAAALAYLTLEQGGRVSLHLLGDGAASVAHGRGQPHLTALLAALDRARPAGRVDLGTDLPPLADQWRGPTHGILLSDLMQPATELDGLGWIVRRGHHLDLIQVLDRGDADPDLDGPFHLVDPEGGTTLPTTVDHDLRAAYRRAVAAHMDAVRRLARRHHMRHLRVAAATPMERALLDYLSLPAEVGR